jgi:hypothetical protein
MFIHSPDKDQTILELLLVTKMHEEPVIIKLELDIHESLFK